MNIHPEAVDNFDANVWSDSDAGGIDLTVTETNEARAPARSGPSWSIDCRFKCPLAEVRWGAVASGVGP